MLASSQARAARPGPAARVERRWQVRATRFGPSRRPTLPHPVARRWRRAGSPSRSGRDLNLPGIPSPVPSSLSESHLIMIYAPAIRPSALGLSHRPSLRCESHTHTSLSESHNQLYLTRSHIHKPIRVTYKLIRVTHTSLSESTHPEASSIAYGTAAVRPSQASFVTIRHVYRSPPQGDGDRFPASGKLMCVIKDTEPIQTDRPVSPDG